MTSRTTALIIEENLATRREVCKALNEDGYKVLCCESIDAFSRSIAYRDIDVFLINRVLPDGDGIQLTRELRSQRDAGIILMSCRSDVVDVVLGLEMGADDYVVKPIRMRELRARVNAVMRRVTGFARLRARTEEPEPQLQHKVHGLTIFGASRTVKRDTGEEVNLTTLEFDVLAVLASVPNRVFSREQILNTVRGPDWVGDDRSIDGLVSRLRTKLFPDGSGTRKIKTVRGVGYMLTR